MIQPTVIIIEPESYFAEKLSENLKNNGFITIIFQNISDSDKLTNLKVPACSIIINLELRDMEGLTLYSSIKNNKIFQETTFALLANNHKVYDLVKNISLDRAVVLNKENDFENILNDILKNIPSFPNKCTESMYTLELEGSFNEISIQDLLIFCRQVFWEGRIILHNRNDFGIICLESGLVKKVYYKDDLIEKAIEEFQKWDGGGFKLERMKYSLERIHKLIEKNGHKTETKKYVVETNDLINDLFYFLHLYLSEQMPKNEVDEIFRKEIYLFKNKSLFSDRLLIEFLIHTEEKIFITSELKNEDLEPVIGLFKSIFQTAKYKYPELELSELLDYLKELQPYLTEIDFYRYLKDAVTNPFETLFLPELEENQELLKTL